MLHLRGRDAASSSPWGPANRDYWTPIPVLPHQGARNDFASPKDNDLNWSRSRMKYQNPCIVLKTDVWNIMSCWRSRNLSLVSAATIDIRRDDFHPTGSRYLRSERGAALDLLSPMAILSPMAMLCCIWTLVTSTRYRRRSNLLMRSDWFITTSFLVDDNMLVNDWASRCNVKSNYIKKVVHSDHRPTVTCYSIP